MKFKRLEPDHPRLAFSCGDDDLDEFYRADSIVGCKQLLSVTYVALDANDDNKVLGYFSVSNDSIRKEEMPKGLIKIIPREKRYRSMPAVKIGRLGVAHNIKRNGIGTRILDYLKVWFTQGNKTGCRFMIVDSYNEEIPLNFYQKNGFEFLTADDKSDETRLMYFDLLKFRPREDT